MAMENDFNHRMEKTAAISGILSIVLYFSAAVLPFIPDFLATLFGISFPLLWIIAFMGLRHHLRRDLRTSTLEIGYLFGVIGAAIACTFIIVQQANFEWHKVAMKSANSELAVTMARSSFNGVNRVQSAMDVAFDVFITIAWFLFGLNLFQNKNFGKIIGSVTCILSAGLLILNLITFPNPPGETGLIDLGPFLGIWLLFIYIKLAKISFGGKNDADYENEETPPKSGGLGIM